MPGRCNNIHTFNCNNFRARKISKQVSPVLASREGGSPPAAQALNMHEPRLGQ